MPFEDLRNLGSAASGPKSDSGGAETRIRLSVDDTERDILEEFVRETADLLEECESALLVLEDRRDDTEAVNTVFRGFHTIKGTAACLELDAISRFAHRAESLFSRVREGELACAGPVADAALEAVDLLKELNGAVDRALRDGEAALPARLGPVTARLDAVAAGESPPPDPDPATATATASPRDPAPDPESAPDPEDPPAGVAIAGSDSIRIRTARLDRLIDMVGELVLSQSMIGQDPGLARHASPELSRQVEQAGKIVRELHDLSLSLRMVPLRAVFRKVQRVVRDLAQRTGKAVELTAAGEDTEIDRNMVDHIADPLVHMVRNALDHGIESPEDRRAAGKDVRGKLRLSASHESGNVVLRLEDDGRGLDRARIVDKAIRRGLIRSDAGMTDAEVFNLLFRPGFSTAEQVTDISGRGVGLDVVRRNIDSLQGRVEIASTPGRGAIFTLRLPLTLAIADGMLVRVGEQRFIIPTVNMRLSFKPEAHDIETVQGRGEVVRWRDELLPLFRLGRLFAIPGAAADPSDGLVVVLEESDSRYALLVDGVLHQQQVVVKSLGRGVGRVYGVSGAAILGDGTVGLILEVSELAALGRRASHGSRTATTDPPHQEVSS